MRYAHIVGWGSYWPEHVLTNDDIAERVDTSDQWIYTRTGIRERRIAGARESTASLAFRAAARALDVAGISPGQVELIIVATSTAEFVFPSTAVRVQDQLGAGSAAAFDLSAACTGFVYALDMAANAIKTGSINVALVIGAEMLSRVVDWTDRGTCILFGDGAGAIVLEGSSVPGGVLATTLHADGSGGNLLELRSRFEIPAPIMGIDFSANGGPHNVIKMNGREVFRFATRVMADAVETVLEKAELTTADVSLVVPHQANVRIIESAAKRLKMDTSRFYMNLEHVGNTSAASIPIALCAAIEGGKLQPNDNVVFVGFGGGLTWGAAVIKWDVSVREAPPDELSWRRSPWYVWARVRSALRRMGRRVLARLAGSPTPDARLRDAARDKERRGD